MADHETIEYIKTTLEQVLAKTGVSARVEYEDSLASGLVFNILSRDAKLLIGHGGGTLQALEHIVRAMVSKNWRPESKERTYFSIDVDDYKKQRQYTLKQMVKDKILELKRSGKPTALPAMLRGERRFVHAYITEQYPHITTESVGEEPNRYIQLSL